MYKIYTKYTNKRFLLQVELKKIKLNFFSLCYPRDTPEFPEKIQIRPIIN